MCTFLRATRAAALSLKRTELPYVAYCVFHILNTNQYVKRKLTYSFNIPIMNSNSIFVKRLICIFFKFRFMSSVPVSITRYRQWFWQTGGVRTNVSGITSQWGFCLWWLYWRSAQCPHYLLLCTGTCKIKEETLVFSKRWNWLGWENFKISLEFP